MLGREAAPGILTPTYTRFVSSTSLLWVTRVCPPDGARKMKIHRYLFGMVSNSEIESKVGATLLRKLTLRDGEKPKRASSRDSRRVKAPLLQNQPIPLLQQYFITYCCRHPESHHIKQYPFPSIMGAISRWNSSCASSDTTYYVLSFRPHAMQPSCHDVQFEKRLDLDLDESPRQKTCPALIGITNERACLEVSDGARLSILFLDRL